MQRPKLSMASQPPPPHHLNFVFIPFMAPGHIIPMIDMAMLLAKQAVTATVVVTHLQATRFSSTIDHAAQSGLSIRLLKIRFPTAEAGLPPGCESADTLPSPDFLPNFAAAINMLQQPLQIMLQNLQPVPSCIISDKLLTWTTEICSNLQIPRIVFDGMSCFTQIVTHNIYFSKIYQTIAPDEPFVVPGLDDEIEITRAQLPGLFNPGPKHVPGFRERVKETEGQAYGVIVNSFEELEKRYVEEFKKLREGRVWCIGPLSLLRSINGDSEREVSISADHSDSADRCLKWLDSRKERSVVYACLGSLSCPSPAQFIELALGLEASNHPFILVVRGGARTEEMWRWIRDEEFEERTRDQGFLVRDWAPQVAILSHSGVGAFLTHCGWNSTLEGICGGIPMITWPLFAEQFLNEKLIVGILEIGVGVGARGVVHVGEEQEVDSYKVRRDGIKEAVERVMDGGDEGFERRKRAGKLAEIAKRSVGEEGSSSGNVELLIQDIQNLVGKKKLMQNDLL